MPGYRVILVIDKRWAWRDDSYASARIENPRIAIGELGLELLPLRSGRP